MIHNNYYRTGKTMENMRRRITIELVSCPAKFGKLINRPTYKDSTSYGENLASVTLQKQSVNFCKPIYVGFAVLELSKTLMYSYHYDVMKAHYKDDIIMVYGDTG